MTGESSERNAVKIPRPKATITGNTTQTFLVDDIGLERKIGGKEVICENEFTGFFRAVKANINLNTAAEQDFRLGNGWLAGNPERAIIVIVC